MFVTIVHNQVMKHLWPTLFSERLTLFMVTMGIKTQRINEVPNASSSLGVFIENTITLYTDGGRQC